MSDKLQASLEIVYMIICPHCFDYFESNSNKKWWEKYMSSFRINFKTEVKCENCNNTFDVINSDNY